MEFITYESILGEIIFHPLVVVANVIGAVVLCVLAWVVLFIIIWGVRKVLGALWGLPLGLVAAKATAVRRIFRG
jgi:hypothetical protein